MENTYVVGFEPWGEGEKYCGYYHDYSSALEKACELLCDSAMSYVDEGYAVASIYLNEKCVWSESVGIDR